MRLAEGFKVEVEKVLGTLKFSALRRETFESTEDGELTDTVKSRTYDLKSTGQKMMVQVKVPGDTPLREFDYNAEVELVEPEFDTVVIPQYRGVEVTWYITAKDIVAKKNNPGAGNNNPGNVPNNGAKKSENAK